VKISVILPTCDRPVLVRTAVESVLQQTHHDWELVVVDDGARDAELSFDDPRILTVRTTGCRGPAAARNLGLDVASGRVVTFLDDDDLLSPGRLAAVAQAHGSARIAVCRARFLDEPASGSRQVSGHLEHTILDGPTPSLGMTSVDVSIVPRFDERWQAVEDVEWWTRLAPQAPVAAIQGTHYLIRRHTGVRGVNGPDARLAENRRFAEEHPYVAAHPRAAAHRWRRVGMLALRGGDPGLSIRAHVRSLRARPSLRTACHLGRSIVVLVRRWVRNHTHPDAQCTAAPSSTSGAESTK
jgi:glycosyltransferase involved in cell wall biosynthesis